MVVGVVGGRPAVVAFRGDRASLLRFSTGEHPTRANSAAECVRVDKSGESAALRLGSNSDGDDLAVAAVHCVHCSMIHR